MLSDFSFTPPGQIFKNLKGGMQMPDMAGKPSKKMEMGDSKKMPGMGASESSEVVAQKWDDQKQTLVRALVQRPAAEVDVNYDALVANRRTLDDPELFSVQPGETVLIRLIAAASSTNFYVDTVRWRLRSRRLTERRSGRSRAAFSNWGRLSALTLE